MIAYIKTILYLCNVNKKQQLKPKSRKGTKIMKTLVERLLNNEAVEVKDVENFTTFEEARPFIIECGKAARAIAKESDSYFTNMAMKEVENAYYEGLHAYGGYNIYVAACHAFGWLKKMYEFKTTGHVTL